MQQKTLGTIPKDGICSGEVSHHTLCCTVSSLSKKLKHPPHIHELTSYRKDYTHLYIYIHIPGHSVEEISGY